MGDCAKHGSLKPQRAKTWGRGEGREGEEGGEGDEGERGKERGIGEGATLGYAVDYTLPREGAGPLQGAMGRQLD